MKLFSTVIRDGQPVGDTESLALSIDHVVGAVAATHADEARSELKDALTWVGGGLVFSAFVLYLGLWNWLVILGLGVGGYGLYRASQAGAETPDVEVISARKRHWTGYAFPRGKGTLVFDATDSVGSTTFNLERVDDPAVLASAQQEIDSLPSFPTVMDREDNLEERIAGVLSDVHTELAEPDSISLEAPVIEQDHAVLTGLERLKPVFDDDTLDLQTPYTMDEAATIVDAIEELEELAFDTDPGQQLQQLRREADDRVEEVVGTQRDAVEVLNDHINTAGDLLAMTSYAFYCPVCLVDEVESPLEATLSGGTTWHCDTCSNTFEEEVVVPKHRMKDELVEDIWDQLWIEKSDERRRVYESIEDQKNELAEREYEQQQTEIRTATSRIKDRRGKVRDLKTRARAGRGKIDEIATLMTKYRGLSEQRKQTFTTEVDEKAAQIQRETERIIEQTQNIDQQNLERAEAEADQKAQVMEMDTMRRHREQMAALEVTAAASVDQAQTNRVIAEASVDQAKTNRASAMANVESAVGARRQTHALDSLEDTQKNNLYSTLALVA